MPTVAIRHELGTIVGVGIVASIIFAAFEMFAAAILMGPAAAMMPLRMIGAMVLGPAALNPGYSLAVAATAGIVIHVALSILFTAMFAWILVAVETTTTGDLLAAPGRLMLTGMMFGLALWLVNFYIIAPVAWRWFPERTNAFVQLVAHTVFFGAPVGAMLERSRAVMPSRFDH
jgi:hypothetical protein